MNVGVLQVSYPFKNLDVLVNHFTSRKSTVIEWGILELVKDAQYNPKLLNTNLSDIFEEILKINDADLLIKPCLIGLQDLEAIKVSGLSDQTSLKEITLSDVELTEKGASMQEKGLLPGVSSEEKIKLSYDLYIGSIKKYSSNEAFTSKNLGHPMVDIETVENTQFPAIQVRSFLESCKTKKAYQWLQETTDISSLVLESSSVVWHNQDKLIEIVDGTIIKIQGAKDNDPVNKAVFNEDIMVDDDRITYNISPLEIEQEVNEAFLYKDLADNIHQTLNKIYKENFNDGGVKSSKKKGKRKKLNKITLVFIDNNFKDQYIDKDLKKLQKLGIYVVYNANEFNLDLDSRPIRLDIPGNISEESCVLLSGNENIFVGKVDLYNMFGNGTFNLGYKKSKVNLNDIKILETLISKYMGKDSRIIVLGAAVSQTMLLDMLKLYIENKNEIDSFHMDNNISIVYETRKLCKELFDKNIDMTDLYKVIIDKNLLTYLPIISFNQVKAIYDKYNTYSKKIDSTEVHKYVKKSIIDNIQYQKSYSDIVNLYKFLYPNDQGKKIEELSKLYTYSIIRDIYLNFKNDDFESNVITSIESNFLRMKNIVKRIQELLPDLDINEDINKTILLEQIVERHDNIKSIKNECLNWNKCMKKLKDIVDIKLLEKDCGLTNIFENISKITDELAIFIDDVGIKFDKVFVIDTCSLLDYSERLNELTKKNLIVVPTMVLQELDNLKQSNDEDKAFKARQAIKTIEELSNKIKLENAILELVPKELTQNNKNNNNDNSILAVAIKYFAKKVTLVTEDINLRNKARSQNIDSVRFEDINKKNKKDESNDDKNNCNK